MSLLEVINRDLYNCGVLESDVTCWSYLKLPWRKTLTLKKFGLFYDLQFKINLFIFVKDIWFSLKLNFTNRNYESNFYVKAGLLEISWKVFKLGLSETQFKKISLKSMQHCFALDQDNKDITFFAKLFISRRQTRLACAHVCGTRGTIKWIMVITFAQIRFISPPRLWDLVDDFLKSKVISTRLPHTLYPSCFLVAWMIFRKLAFGSINTVKTQHRKNQNETHLSHIDQNAIRDTITLSRWYVQRKRSPFDKTYCWMTTSFGARTRDSMIIYDAT